MSFLSPTLGGQGLGAKIKTFEIERNILMLTC